MKANAPEKLYLIQHNGLICYRRNNDEDIEYVRKDAFIEKVENFLNKKDDRDSYTIGYIRRHLKEIIKEVGL